jgi:formylmethanofuran dehydrogenase subunit E
VAAVVERPAELLRLAEVEAAVVARAAEAPAAVRCPKCSELFRLDQ